MNSRIIKYYKGVILETIYKYFHSVGYEIDRDILDEKLKSVCGLSGSTLDMTNLELQQLCELSITYFYELTSELETEAIEIKFPSEL